MSLYDNLMRERQLSVKQSLPHTLKRLIGPLNRTGLIGSLVVVGIFLLLFLQQSTFPYTIDEAAFPYGAEGILKYGAPYFYNGETRPNDLGLWHPPLYIYSLAMNMLLFGGSHVAVRIFGAICVIITLIVIFRIAAQVAPRLPQLGYVALAAIFTLNPLILSGALVPDIDGTVGLLAVAFGILTTIKLASNDVRLPLLVYLTLTWLLLLYTKFVLAILVLPILLAAPFFASFARIRRLGVLALGLLLGSLLFLSTYLPFARLAGFPASAPFDYFRANFQRGRGGTGFIEGVLAHLSPGGGVFYFLTPALIGAAILAFLSFVTKSRFGVSRRHVILLAGSGFWMLLFYAFITGSPYTFPKYWGVAVIPLSLLTALLTYPVQKVFDSIRTWPSLLLRVCVFSVALVGVLAISAWGFHRFCEGLVLANRDLHAEVLMTIALFVLLGVALLVLFSMSRPPHLWNSLAGATALALVISVCVTSLCVDLANRSTPVSTRYYLSEKGLQEAINEIRSVTSVNDYLIAPKDIGLQSDRRFFEDAALLGLSEDQLRRTLTDNPAQYLVTRNKWDYSALVFPSSFEILEEFFTPMTHQNSTDIVIWKRKLPTRQ